ncbi:hypothetical protein FBY40_1678 [Microbacterium sp. SLBN-154]|uniref:hypothetical protein n=1 Tax=Microbacterium sp. SLBN-154 TaxID=2768458 RepID=UPI00114F0F5E|nr:hypothetical protein [Microbacterium sp. SLBN-154]TQK19185.1 hypothetical protein FBY40_1678 [Microbacterium sp. SLBN-154]
MTNIRRALAAGAGVAVVLAVAAGCVPEPGGSPSPTASTTSPSPSVTPVTPVPTPSPIETMLPDTLQLPERCEDIYSADMLASLNAQNPPLNDPGVTMYSTENAVGLEILAAGPPSIRCSWGTPSESGLATTVTVIDAAQAAALRTALLEAGFGCEEALGGTVCRIEQRGVSLDDVPYLRGETHVVRDNGWVATAYINFTPEGYSEDIVQTLWG